MGSRSDVVVPGNVLLKGDKMKTKTEKTMAVKVEFTDEEVRSLLVSAFEGGSNYWYTIKEYNLADGLSREDFRGDGKFTVEGWSEVYTIPFTEGCSLTIGDMEEGGKPDVKLDREKLEKGLTVMYETMRHHLTDFIDDKTDATTGDVFLQCALWGECIYG